MLAQVPTMEPIYTTSIYASQMEQMVEIDPLIQDIIQQNIVVPVEAPLEEM